MQLIYKTISTFSGLPDTISEWEFKELSNEKIKPPHTENKSLSPKLIWTNNSKTRLRFTGNCLIAVNLYIAYVLDRWSQDLNAEFTLKSCLFGNADLYKYSYSGYEIGSDSRSLFSIPNFDWGKNVIIFGVHMSSSTHANNKNKDILILGKRQKQGLDNTTLTAEAEYFINFSRSKRKFCLSLHYNGSHSFLFVNGTKYISSKQKILK